MGGNIGTPLSQWILSGEHADSLVLEVSSFQLDTANTFRPDIGVLLNVTEDHLDRYENFKAYTDSKISLFQRQNCANFAVISADDPICRKRSTQIPGKVLYFSHSDLSVKRPG